MTSIDTRSELAWIVQLPIVCAGCRKEFLETIGRLVKHTELPCPNCGAIVDLSTEKHRASIQEFAELCGKRRSFVAKIKRRPKSK